MIKRGRIFATLGLILGDLSALIALRPDVGALATDLTAPHAWVASAGADIAASTLAGAALWCVAVWLGVGLTAAAATQLPGTLGRLARAVSRAVLPGAVYRVVAGAAGLGVLFAPVAAGALTAPRLAGGGPTVTSSAVVPSIPSPIWPATTLSPADAHGPSVGTRPEVTTAPNTKPMPTPTWPSSPVTRMPPIPKRATGSAAGSAPAPVPRAVHPRPARHSRATQPVTKAPIPGRAVVIRSGDSLWRVAAARLGRKATPANIADSWPQWYAANRAAIGDDPGLIRVGQVLQPPAPAGSGR